MLRRLKARLSYRAKMNELNFIDIEEAVPPVQTVQQTNGQTSLNSLANLQIGTGAKVMRADPSGLWLGANKWADAPFRVDMEGNVVASSATFPNLTTITIFKQASIPTSIHVADLWFDTDDANKIYRAASVGADQITAGEWEDVTNTDIGDALTKAGVSQEFTGDIQVGSTSGVKIDGANKRILIYDNSANPIIVIGYVA